MLKKDALVAQMVEHDSLKVDGESSNLSEGTNNLPHRLTTTYHYELDFANTNIDYVELTPEQIENFSAKWKSTLDKLLTEDSLDRKVRLNKAYGKLNEI